MFTRAGFNATHRRTGIWVESRGKWLELIIFQAGDWAWYSARHSILTWGGRHLRVASQYLMPNHWALVDQGHLQTCSLERERRAA